MDMLTKEYYKQLVEKLRQEPDKKLEYKENFLEILEHNLSTLIEIEQDYDQAFNCFKTSQEIFGDNDPDILNVLGVKLNRLDKPLEALNYLRLAIQNAPDNLTIFTNYESIVNQWVSRWHFSMLNDTIRNSAYKRAITKKIQENQFQNILDIGTGTGLLSIYCFEAGAKNITACETNDIMLNIAEEIFNKNKISVNLLNDHSTNLSNTKKYDLIITEIFDSGGFGEDVLSTLIHAKENLLKNETGKILPEKIKIYVVGVDRIGRTEKLNDINSTLENSIYLKDTLIIPEKNDTEPYEPFEQVGSKIVLTTEPTLAISVDFNDINSLRDAQNGKLDCNVKLSSLDDGTLEGFFVFFELYLNDNEILTNFNTNVRTNHFQCWDPIVFPLNLPIQIRKYQIFNVNLSVKDGILKLTHGYDNIAKRHLEIPKDVFDYLSDDEFIHELEYNVNKSIKKRSLENMIDFLPFPHIGINLLKEAKILKLYCSSNVKDIVQKIANWNCIPEESIKFIDNFDDLNKDFDSIQFDIILLQPITRHGELNSEHLKYYDLLKTKYLTINGIIFPGKIDICCKLIQSNWLENVTRVTNSELLKLNIEQNINKYATKHQYEYIDFDTNDLSELFTFHVQFDNKLVYKKNIVVNLNTTINNDDNIDGNNVNTFINGILYFYKIYFVNNSIPIMTNRKKSFCKTNCFVQKYNTSGRTNVSINFLLNDFAFFCKIFDENK